MKATKITVYKSMVALDYQQKDKEMSAVIFNHNIAELTNYDMSAVSVNYKQENPDFLLFVVSNYLAITNP